MTMKTSQPSSSQGGFTYATVVVTLIVVGLMLAAYLKLVAVQNQFVARSEVWNRTVPVIEAGVEEAMAHLNKNASGMSLITGETPNMNADGWIGNSTVGWTKTGRLGSDYYVAKIDPWVSTNAPDIKAAGYVWRSETFVWNSSFGAFMANYSDVLENLIAQRRIMKRDVDCTTTNLPLWSPPFVARKGINMNGNNVTVDSFDSKIAGRNVGGRWHISVRRDNGDIASNDTITNAVNVGNANVYGKVRTGPHGTVAHGPNGKVGSLAWHANNANKGVQPGWFKDDMNMEFPDVVMPNVAWSSMPSGGTRDGTSYTYIFDSPGYYRSPSGLISGKILVNATNVYLRVDGGWKFSGQDMMYIKPTANIIIYLNCTSAQITGQGILNSNVASQCYIFGTSKLVDLDIGGNGECTAAIYAPYASVKLHGGGSSDNDFSGGLIARDFTFTGHYHLHADEALKRLGINMGYAVTSWNEK
jgi:hypothetical protein